MSASSSQRLSPDASIPSSAIGLCSTDILTDTVSEAATMSAPSVRVAIPRRSARSE